MGRTPCCDKTKVKRGPWSSEEDTKLKEFIDKNGTGGNWIALPQKAGLQRCGKSCRLRWLNYLRPNIKHGDFSENEDRIICSLFATIGSRWSIIAAQLPGRTDNDIKNYWNTKLKKKLLGFAKSNQQYVKHQHQQLLYSSPLENNNIALTTNSQSFMSSPFIFNSSTTSDLGSSVIMFGLNEQSTSSSSEEMGFENNYLYGGFEGNYPLLDNNNSGGGGDVNHEASLDVVYGSLNDGYSCLNLQQEPSSATSITFDAQEEVMYSYYYNMH